MNARAAADRIVQGALNRTPEGLRGAVERAGQVVRSVESDAAHDQGARAMALLAIYGIVHRALLAMIASDPLCAIAEADHESSTH